MNTQIQTWLESIVFDFLVLALIVSTIVFLIGWLCASIGFKQSAAVRFRIWQVAFVLAIILPIGMITLPKWKVSIPVPEIVPPQERLRSDDAIATVPRLKNQSLFRQPSEIFMTPTTGSNSEPVLTDDLMGSIELDSNSISSSTEIRQPSSWKMWVSIAWLFGVSLFLVRLVIANLTIASWRRQSEAMGFKKAINVPVRFCSAINVPITTGIINPMILLPRHADDWSQQRIDMVVQHELAHVHRRDLFWNLVSNFSKCVLWFQPLTLIGHRSMTLMREQACDDRVIQNGVSAKQYAKELLALTNELVNQRHLANALAISQPPIETRLKSILSQGNRNDLSRRWKIVLWLSLLLTVFSASAIRPFVQPVVANKTSPQANDIEAESPNDRLGNVNSDRDRLAVTIPETLSGTLIDENGVAVVGATVQLGIHLSPRNTISSRWQKLGVWRSFSDDDGKFTIAIPEMSQKQTKTIQARLLIQADGFVPVTPFVSRKQLLNQGSLGEHKLDRGRLLTGKVVKPDAVPYGPPRKAIIRLAGLSNRSVDHKLWFSQTVRCEPDGTFKCYVPRSGRMTYVAESENYAAVAGHFKAPEDFSDDQDVGEIALAKGAIVVGKVLDRKNKPIEGAVVRLHRQRVSRHELRNIPIHSYVKTNDMGGYQFTPQTGDCVVTVVDSGFSPQSSFFESIDSDINPPVVTPIRVNLNGDGVASSVNLNLRTAKTVSIKGTFLWDDGSPAEGVAVWGNVPVKGSNASETICKAITDKQGGYTIELPEESPSHYLMAFGQQRNGVSHFPYPTETYDALQKSSQLLVLENNKVDLTGIDWVLRDMSQVNAKAKLTGDAPSPPAMSSNLKVRPVSVPAKPYISVADKALLEISNEYYAGVEKYSVLYKNVSIGKQKKEVVNRQSAFTAKIYDKLFEFEAKFRGDISAVNAMSEIIQQCCNCVGEYREKPAIEKAYQRALKTLDEWYVENENIWLTFSTFENAFPPERYPLDFVRHVQANNPFPRNRCYAHYSEAKFLYTLLYFKDWLEQNNWKTEWMRENDIEYFRNLDRNKAIAAINENIKVIQTQYAGIDRLTVGQSADINFHTRPFQNSWVSFVERRTKSSSVDYQDIAFTELAGNIDFKVNQLVVGKPFPIDYWKDEVEQAVAKAKGKNVLLMITFSNRDEVLRNFLPTATSNRNLELIWLRSGNVGGDSGLLDHMNEIAEVIYDQAHRSMAQRWSQADTEAYYLIDEDGVLRAIDIDLASIVDRIETLLD